MSRQKTIASSSSGKRFLIVLTTTLVLLVSCGPTIQALLFSHGPDTSLAHDPSTEDQEEDADIAKVSAVYEAVIPLCKIQVAFCCSFIRTFSFIEKVITPEGAAVSLSQSNYFRILFRQIISPNAP